MRVIVTGSRAYTRRDLIEERFDALGPGPHTIVHGGCPTGADAVADELARARGWDVVVYEADWRKLGRSAGPIRNARMVADGADLVIAFPMNGGRSNGTYNAIQHARRAGLQVAVVDYRELPEKESA